MNPPPIAGNNQVKRNPITAAAITHIKGASTSILSTSPLIFEPIPDIACLKLFMMVGKDLISEINPPIATAPAPIYLI